MIAASNTAGVTRTARSNKTTIAAMVLILFGLIALFGGGSWLVVLVPAALLVWYTASPRLRTGRN